MAKPAPIDDVPTHGGGIRLGQFLQLAGLVDSGGEAKEAIRSGDVLVNGDVDVRRGRQLQAGDIVSLGGHKVRVGE